MPLRRILGPAVILILLAGCGDGTRTVLPPASPSTAPSGAASATPSASATATATATLPAGVDQVVRASYVNGTVSGPKGRVKVKRGSTVQLVVTSDKADEVHLHGYDQSMPVKAGSTVRLTFKATIAGVFEVELEERAVRLARLQVQ